MDETLLNEFDTFASTQEQPQEVAPTELIEISTEAPKETDLLSGFDTFTEAEQPKQTEIVEPITQAPIQQTQQPIATPTKTDAIEQYKSPDMDDDTWMDIKNRVSKFLGEYTPIMSIPKIVAETVGEAQQKEGSQVAEAISVKSRLENIENTYGDLVTSLKVPFDEEFAKYIQEKRDNLNNEVVSILEDRGIEAYYDNGKLKVVTKDENGNDTLKDLDEETFNTIMSDFKSGAGEITAGIMGAGRGAVAAQRMLPLTASPQQRATAGIIGAGLGGYTGSAIGRATDIVRNAISLNKEIDTKDVLTKATEAGMADTVGTALIGTIAKLGAKPLEIVGKLTDKAQTLLKQGNLRGAYNQVKKDFDLTDADIETAWEKQSESVEYAKDLTGDDLLRAKITAAVMQSPQGLAPTASAMIKSPKAAIETSKEISARAKEVQKIPQMISKKPSAIKKSIEDYEKSVSGNYKEVREMIDEALPIYKTDLDVGAFKDTILDVNKRVIDPDVKAKVENLAEVLSNQKIDTVGDLIDTRQLFNKFYGKNAKHFENARDKESLMSIQNTIDGKISEAIDSIDNPKVAQSLKDAFSDAKAQYKEMFDTIDTASYKAIFKKGASEEEIGKNLVKYSKATDGDLETVLSKLKPAKRVQAEFGIIDQLVKKATFDKQAKAIDFDKLLKDVKTSESAFKTDEAKQFINNIKNYDEKFSKDVELQIKALGVTPKEKKNISTSLEGKIWMELSSMRFEALQRLAPTENGRRLSIQKAIGMALEKSRTPKEFFFNASKIKDLPNTDREQLKKAVKAIGDKERLLQKTIEENQVKTKKQEADTISLENVAKNALSEKESKNTLAKK